MNNVWDISKNKPHFVVAVLCVKCTYKWIGTIPEQTPLFSLECPRCHAQDSFPCFLPDDFIEE